jgi:hypothetical protein
VFAIRWITEAVVAVSLSVASRDFGWRLGWGLGGVALGVALLACRAAILRWLRVGREGSAGPETFASAAIALLAFCAGSRIVIDLALTVTLVLTGAIPRVPKETWGEVAVLVSCLLLIPLAQPIASLPRATRTSRASW